MGSFFGMLICLCIAFAAWLSKENKSVKIDRAANAERKAIVRPAVTLMTEGEYKVGYMRDYVGEFEFANRKYQEMWTAFKREHPIGSFYDYRDWGKEDIQTLLLKDVSDQEKAFKLDYRFDRMDTMGPQRYALWKAREDAAKRGYAPDNVKTTVFPCYDTKKDPGHSDLNSKNHWVEDEKYNASFYLSASYKTDLFPSIKPVRCPSGRERMEIFPYCGPEQGMDDKRYQEIRDYLQKRQDEENAIIQHKLKTNQLPAVKLTNTERQAADVAKNLKQTGKSGSTWKVVLGLTVWCVLWLALAFVSLLQLGDTSPGVALGVFAFCTAPVWGPAIYLFYQLSRFK